MLGASGRPLASLTVCVGIYVKLNNGARTAQDISWHERNTWSTVDVFSPVLSVEGLFFETEI